MKPSSSISRVKMRNRKGTTTDARGCTRMETRGIGRERAQTSQRETQQRSSLRSLHPLAAIPSVFIRVHPWFKFGFRAPSACLLALAWLGMSFTGWGQQRGEPDIGSTNAAWVPLVMHPVKDTATLELLRAVLKESDPVVRERALEALAIIRDPVDATRLRALLEVKSIIARQQAAAASPDALRSTNTVALIHALRGLDAETARKESKTLLALLRRPDVAVQEEAVNAIQRGKIAAAAPELIARLDDPDEGLRLAACRALVVMAKDVSQPELIAAMVRRMELDPSSQVRGTAGLALAFLHDAPALDALLRLLKHARGETRASAAHALGLLILKPELAHALHPLLSDREDLVARAAASSLAILNNPESKVSLLTALQKRGPVVQERAAHALGVLKDTNAVTSLIDRLGTTNEPLKVALVLALGKIGDKRALPPLRNVLQQIVLANNLPKARKAAFVALTEMRDKLAIPRAIQVVTTAVVPPAPGAGPTFDEDYVRIAGLRYLAALGDKTVGAKLLASLKEWVPREMRPAVAETLSELLGKKYQPISDEDYRHYFVESLAPRPVSPAAPPGVVLVP